MQFDHPVPLNATAQCNTLEITLMLVYVLSQSYVSKEPRLSTTLEKHITKVLSYLKWLATPQLIEERGYLADKRNLHSYRAPDCPVHLI